MADDNSKGQRRVYVLPRDLVERIDAFQKAMGMQSEVEAVRHLLDEALKHRDSAVEIIQRFCLKMKHTKILSDIAKDVLVGHPKISSIEFSSEIVTARMVTGEGIVFYSFGGGRLEEKGGNSIKFDEQGELDDIPF